MGGGEAGGEEYTLKQLVISSSFYWSHIFRQVAGFDLHNIMLHLTLHLITRVILVQNRLHIDKFKFVHLSGIHSFILLKY